MPTKLLVRDIVYDEDQEDDLGAIALGNKLKNTSNLPSSTSPEFYLFAWLFEEDGSLVAVICRPP